jgi:hypothetical protein
MASSTDILPFNSGAGSLTTAITALDGFSVFGWTGKLKRKIDKAVAKMIKIKINVNNAFLVINYAFNYNL